MFLKSMEMFGFKSFADKTQLQFEPGITSIVGPNGCGKSNVVDAIKWVLGEKQAKNIRGEKMEDIIFSGTENRKQLSLAEVSVTINNANKILEIDSDSVTIGRRVYRDGESEYLINKSPVRLKDIEKLLMDTGIGKSAYSVMEQGKMDLILSTRAEDRRYIFEEAAGISRYKLQKKESLKKLQETGSNLERINDIIKEVEREKDFKSKQADKTKIYLRLKTELSDNDIKVNVIKFINLFNKQNKIQNDIERLNEERDVIMSRVSSISANNEKDEKKKNDIQHQLFELEKRLQAYKIRVEDIDQKSEKNRTFIQEQELRKNSVTKKLDERNSSLHRLVEEKEKAKQSGIEISEKIQKDKEKLSNFFETRKRKIDSIHQSRDRIEKNKYTIKEKEGKLKELRESLEIVIKRLIDAIDKRKAELVESESERVEVRDRIHNTIEEIERSALNIISDIENSNNSDAIKKLNLIDFDSLKSDIKKFESYEDGFRSILFDKTGIHAEKEELDEKISVEVLSVDELRLEIGELEKYIQKEQLELEDVNEMITRIEKDLSKNENEKDWIEKHIKTLDNQIIDIEKQIENHKEDIVRSEGIIENLKKEIKEWEERLIEFSERSEALIKNISELTEKRTELDKKISERKQESKKDENDLQRVNERISSLDKNQVELIFRKNNIEEYLWTEYEKKIKNPESIKLNESQLGEFQQKMQSLKKEIHDLGPINNLAIQEYKDLKKRFEYYIDQKKDIEKAREDILSVIEEINKTSIEIFNSTFEAIQKNFSEVFRRLFEGGSASLHLTDEENVLECGIDIVVSPPGKKQKNINLLSGGERALTAIALLFATYMVKPSPFCFLDEIDAPLDEGNIGRFVNMLKEFARGTQFVIVTHNKKTMSISESIYGVTMEEPGSSKVVSLMMSKLEDKSAQ